MCPEARNKQGPNPPLELEKLEIEVVRPFDLRDLEHLPTANDNDPPYRPWWAIDRA
jgi:hypothetical protein